MATLTKGKSLGDLLKYELSPAYCRGSAVFRNNVGAEISIDSPIGLPTKVSAGKRVPVLAGDEANVTGLLLNQEKIFEMANNTDAVMPQPFLLRGPAIVNRDALPTEDPAGDAYDLDDIATALAALDPPIIVVSNPTETTEQTT